ncbi:hypothetical protein AVEN_136214-1 [Araneus ventricosus]|uniref:C2H2-type domain-containing protein n=1 Tax=Araneus ventricosus TaxID=182803 RepID=A0A4Y2X1S6_ARAVE|nr:hypothetical protein AVEN_136214-1 [Araneus ventricosus]
MGYEVIDRDSSLGYEGIDRESSLSAWSFARQTSITGTCDRKECGECFRIHMVTHSISRIHKCDIRPSDSEKKRKLNTHMKHMTTENVLHVNFVI